MHPSSEFFTLDRASPGSANKRCTFIVDIWHQRERPDANDLESETFIVREQMNDTPQ